MNAAAQARAQAMRDVREGFRRPDVTCQHCGSTSPGRVGWITHMRAKHPDILAAVRLYAGSTTKRAA